MQFGMILTLFFAVIAVIFAVQNTATARLNFFIWYFDLPLAILMILALTIGALFAAVFTLPGWLRWKKSDRAHKKELSGLEDSLSKYRADLIDTQNKNKDLRQKIFELEEAKDHLESAQVNANREIQDMTEAISKAQLTAAEADQARKEAIEARNELDSALKMMEEKMKFSEEKAEIMRQAMESQTASVVPVEESAPIEPHSDLTFEPTPMIPTETDDDADAPVDSKTDSSSEEEEKESPKKHFGLW